MTYRKGVDTLICHTWEFDISHLFTVLPTAISWTKHVAKRYTTLNGCQTFCWKLASWSTLFSHLLAGNHNRLLPLSCSEWHIEYMWRFLHTCCSLLAALSTRLIAQMLNIIWLACLHTMTRHAGPIQMNWSKTRPNFSKYKSSFVHSWSSVYLKPIWI